MSGGQVSYALFVQYNNIIMCTYVCVILCICIKTCKYCTYSKLVHVHVKPLATHLVFVEFTLRSKINNACRILQPEGWDVRLD